MKIFSILVRLFFGLILIGLGKIELELKTVDGMSFIKGMIFSSFLLFTVIIFIG